MPWVPTMCPALYHGFAGIVASTAQVLTIAMRPALSWLSFYGWGTWCFRRGSNLFRVTQLAIGKVRIQIQVSLTLELELFLMLHCLKSSNRFKDTHTHTHTHGCACTHAIPTPAPSLSPSPPILRIEDLLLCWGNCSLSTSSWYWKPKWSTFRDSEVFQWSGLVTALSQLCGTYREVHELKSRVVFCGCSVADLQGLVPYQIPGCGQWAPAVSSGASWISPVCGSPFSWSCPHSLLIERLFTIEHPVGRMLPQCFERCVSSDMGGQIFARQYWWSCSSSLSLSFHNSCRASWSVPEDWVCSP